MAKRQIVITKHDWQIFLEEGKVSKKVGKVRGWDKGVYEADLETDKGLLKIFATTQKELKKIVNKEFDWIQGDQSHFKPKKRGVSMSMAEMKILIGI